MKKIVLSQLSRIWILWLENNENLFDFAMGCSKLNILHCPLDFLQMFSARFKHMDDKNTQGTKQSDLRSVVETEPEPELFAE